MAKRFGITRGVPPAAFGFARVSVRGRSTLGGIEAGPNNLPHQTGHANEVSSSFSVPLRVSRLLNWVVWTLRFPMNNMHLGLFGVLGMLCGMLLYLVLVQREQEFCLRESSESLGTTMLSYHVVQVAGWPSTAA